MLIDHLPSGTDSNALLTYLNEILAGTAVVVMRNLNNDSALNDLWLQCKHAMPMGQTFNNEKIAILIASPKLQREDFFLWLYPPLSHLPSSHRGTEGTEIIAISVNNFNNVNNDNNDNNVNNVINENHVINEIS